MPVVRTLAEKHYYTGRAMPLGSRNPQTNPCYDLRLARSVLAVTDRLLLLLLLLWTVTPCVVLVAVVAYSGQRISIREKAPTVETVLPSVPFFTQKSVEKTTEATKNKPMKETMEYPCRLVFAAPGTQKRTHRTTMGQRICWQRHHPPSSQRAASQYRAYRTDVDE